uniref:Uncharacterized protein n=1 Tax=Lepeophtheirus salmonis TaxID=72036 RepID=A0A0K2UFC8_LEPSM
MDEIHSWQFSQGGPTRQSNNPHRKKQKPEVAPGQHTLLEKGLLATAKPGPQPPGLFYLDARDIQG